MEWFVNIQRFFSFKESSLSSVKKYKISSEDGSKVDLLDHREN